MKRLTILFLFACAIAFGQTRVYNHNIDGMGWIQLRDSLKLDFSVQDYYIASRDGDRLSFIAADSNNIIDMFGGDGDGKEEIIWNLWGKGTPTDISDSHWLRIWYNLAGNEYCITTKAQGTQGYRDLLISADGSPDQFRLDSLGNVSFADTITNGVWGGTEIDTASFARVSDTISSTIVAAQISDFDTEVSNNTDVAANTSARHNAVTVSGTPDYITLSGQDIVRGQVDLTTDVTGVLPAANVAKVDNAFNADTAATLQGYDTTAFVTISGGDSVSGTKVFEAPLTVINNGGSGIAPSGFANDFVVTGITNTGMSLSTVAGGNSNFFFGEAGNSDKAAHIQFTGSVNELRIGADNFNTMRVSSGSLRVDTIFNVYPEGSTLGFQVEGDGTLNTGATANYETLVTADDDIPNKKYVDDHKADSAVIADTSLVKYLNIPLFACDSTTSVLDGVMGVVIPNDLDGYVIVNAEVVICGTSNGTSGTTDVQLRRRRAGSDVDVLSTKLTLTGGTDWKISDEVINLANDDLNWGDALFGDVDAIATGAIEGLMLVITVKPE